MKIVIVTLALVAMLVVVGLFQVGPWVKRCERVSPDLDFSYNGGCDDPSVPTENQDYFSDYDLQGT